MGNNGSNTYYRVKMMHSSETHVCSWNDATTLEDGTVVVAPGRYGKDMARVLGPVCAQCLDREKVHGIVRIATDEDRKKYEANISREEDAVHICREKIAAHGLEMKLVSAHYLTDESKLLFFFTADDRVDFRALVKDLVAEFHMRIELRQIGVRDESRVLGGLAVCGRPFCCHGLTDKLTPVSIKMAKEQNLSLNSMKISGPCGRLLCCLSYEYDYYREEKRALPSEGTRIRYNDVTYRIQEVNILSKRVRLSSQDGRVRDLPFCSFRRNPDNKRWEITAIEEEG